MVEPSQVWRARISATTSKIDMMAVVLLEVLLTLKA